MDTGIIFILVVTLIVAAVIFFVRRHERRYKKMLTELKQAYQHELRNGTKESALAAGRLYYAALNGGHITAVSEQAINNDLSTMP